MQIQVTIQNPKSFELRDIPGFEGPSLYVAGGPTLNFENRQDAERLKQVLDGYFEAFYESELHRRDRPHVADCECPACDVAATSQNDGSIRKCHLFGCNKIADFEVYDENEQRPDYGPTDSCEQHVGRLLGSVPPTEPIGPWRVIPILPKADSTCRDADRNHELTMAMGGPVL